MTEHAYIFLINCPLVNAIFQDIKNIYILIVFLLFFSGRVGHIEYLSILHYSKFRFLNMVFILNQS